MAIDYFEHVFEVENFMKLIDFSENYAVNSSIHSFQLKKMTSLFGTENKLMHNEF